MAPRGVCFSFLLLTSIVLLIGCWAAEQSNQSGKNSNHQTAVKSQRTKSDPSMGTKKIKDGRRTKSSEPSISMGTKVTGKVINKTVKYSFQAGVPFVGAPIGKHLGNFAEKKYLEHAAAAA